MQTRYEREQAIQAKVLKRDVFDLSTFIDCEELFNSLSWRWQPKVAQRPGDSHHCPAVGEAFGSGVDGAAKRMVLRIACNSSSAVSIASIGSA